MKNFTYMARDASGVRMEGQKQAVSSGDILGWLREQNFTPIAVEEITAFKAKPKRYFHKKRIKSADLAAVCWQLTTMLEGGIPITAALETISDDVDNLQLQDVLGEILVKLKKGESLSDSISEFPSVFNRMSRALVMAGESGGNLPQAFERLAEYYENRDKLAKKIKGAMAYPIFVLGFIILIITAIMTFIIPRFTAIFDQLGSELPAFTRAFMGVYDFLRFNLIYIIGSMLLLMIFSVLTYTKTKKGHYIFSKILLRLPLFGKLYKYAFVTSFCKTMSTLLSTGVSVLEVFNILTTMTSNDIIESAITKSRDNIVEGNRIAASVASSGFFPNLVIKMVQVGEESGSLSNVLGKTADYYERKLDAIINTLTSLLEPIMIVSVGAIVATVLVALYLPIFSLGPK